MLDVPVTVHPTAVLIAAVAFELDIVWAKLVSDPNVMLQTNAKDRQKYFMLLLPLPLLLILQTCAHLAKVR
jgi:hypothetical protein